MGHLNRPEAAAATRFIQSGIYIGRNPDLLQVLCKLTDRGKATHAFRFQAMRSIPAKDKASHTLFIKAHLCLDESTFTQPALILSLYMTFRALNQFLSLYLCALHIPPTHLRSAYYTFASRYVCLRLVRTCG